MLPIFISALLTSTLLIFATLPSSSSHAIPSRLTRRQGCSSLEPNDPNCLLPLWNDKTYNLTFDDFPASTTKLTSYDALLFTNFTLAHPNLTSSAPMLLPYANSTTYTRLPANKIGHISIAPTPSPSSSSSSSTTTRPLDFFKLQALTIGCTHHASKLPTNCTVQITGMCAGPNSTSTQDVRPWSWDVGFEVARGTRRAEVQWMSLGTYGERWLCYNYTVTGTRAQGEEGMRGRGPTVWLDQIEVVEYTESAIFGR